MDLEADDVRAQDEVAVLDGNGGAHVHQLVVLDLALCVVGDGLIGHVVGVDLLAVDVDDDAVGGLDGEGEGGVAVEVVDDEGLSEVGGGSDEVAELTGLGLLPGAGGTALGLGPVGGGRGAAVQVLVGGVLGGDEVADVEVEVLGGFVGAERAVEDDGVVSEEDSEVADVPAVAAAVGEGQGVGSTGEALGVVVGLLVDESALGEEGATAAVLQGESHLVASVAGLNKDGELVVGEGAILYAKGHLGRDSFTLGGLGGDGVGRAGQGDDGSAANRAGGGIDLEGQLEGWSDGEVGVEVGGGRDLGEGNAHVTDVGVGIEGEGGDFQLVKVDHREGELGDSEAVRGGGGNGGLGDDHSVDVESLLVVGHEEAASDGSAGEVGVGDVAEELEG